MRSTLGWGCFKQYELWRTAIDEIIDAVDLIATSVLKKLKSAKSDGTDKSQNLKNSRRANATIIKLMVDSCTHKFSFFTFVGRVKSGQPNVDATHPHAEGRDVLVYPTKVNFKLK